MAVHIGEHVLIAVGRRRELAHGDAQRRVQPLHEVVPRRVDEIAIVQDGENPACVRRNQGPGLVVHRAADLRVRAQVQLPTGPQTEAPGVEGQEEVEVLADLAPIRAAHQPLWHRHGQDVEKDSALRRPTARTGPVTGELGAICEWAVDGRRCPIDEGAATGTVEELRSKVGEGQPSRRLSRLGARFGATRDGRRQQAERRDADQQRAPNPDRVALAFHGLPGSRPPASVLEARASTRRATARTGISARVSTAPHSIESASGRFGGRARA